MFCLGHLVDSLEVGCGVGSYWFVFAYLEVLGAFGVVSVCDAGGLVDACLFLYASP
jgi:hypothetical protein